MDKISKRETQMKLSAANCRVSVVLKASFFEAEYPTLLRSKTTFCPPKSKIIFEGTKLCLGAS